MVVTHLVTSSAFSENNITFILKNPSVGGMPAGRHCHFDRPALADCMG